MKLQNILFVFLLSLICFAAVFCSSEKNRSEIVLSGPAVDASFPMVCMAARNVNLDGKKIRFIPWSSPDQLRALVSGKQIDLAAVSTNASANLYNRGISVRQLLVSVPGNGEIIASFNISRLSDLKGKTIVMPFKGDTPDIVFQLVMKKCGFLHGRDYRMIYSRNPVDVLQYFFSGRADAAFVSEMASSIAIEKMKKEGKKGRFVLPLHKEWKNHFKRETLPVAGICSVGKINSSPHMLSLFIRKYRESVSWCKENPGKAAEIAVKYFPSLKKESVRKRIINSDFKFKKSGDVKSDMLFLYKIFMKKNPALIGHKLPGDNFFSNGR